ncbi:DNA-binding protein [Halarcobacter ebronensis]|uniref:DNA-binding protein n=1 Tax=Halarcobacter ebronensis TaxID=1462615 RepID=A0A4Q1AP23_9BACT|nr:DNA-binding protein [Halarcobacter ebronensis]QKF80541.1 hypothetical protein AEBR_0022 [Halarcobacter ebronensis]RXK08348.1 DNA-binding protein [Halarcobacter ebronensis]
MERLVTTAQAAEILGISLQGIHYRIKKKQLKSLKKSGKTFVYVDDYQELKENKEPIIELKEFVPNETIKEIIKAKDEQIDILKTSVKWMKKQYISEISRLEKNQKRIIGVFNREIELLQSAFNEMRSIYKPQIEFHTQQAAMQQQSHKEQYAKDRFMTLQDFTLLMKRNNKSEKEIKLIILKAVQGRDKRFIYNRKDKKLLILKDDFSDLI